MKLSRTRPDRRLLLFAAWIGLMLTAAGLCRRPAAPSRPFVTPPAFRLAAVRLADPPAAPALSVEIVLESASGLPADPDLLRSLHSEALPWPETKPEILPDWVQWGRLTGPRATCSSSESGAAVYAIHEDAVVTLVLVNRTGRRIQTRLRARLPRGTYSIERLTFASPGGDPSSPEIRKTEQDGASSASLSSGSSPFPYSPYLERLEGCNLTHASSVEKRGSLEPEQAVLYRFVDRHRMVRLDWAETYQRLHRLALRHPGAARRMRRVLDENQSALNALRDTVGFRSRTAALHQLLLAAAQAEAMHHDYQLRGLIHPDVGAPLTESLTHLIDDLSETGAVLLGLVPQVRVEPDGLSAQTVTVVLANTSERDVAAVKLGLQTSGLPKGAACEPIDSTYFGVLKSGQTARAVFHLHGPPGEAIATTCYAADVCYFVGGGPAHLRPRPW